MEYTSVVTRKGQVTVPAEIRKSMGLKRGDKIAWVEENGHVTVRQARSVAERTAGIARPYLQGRRYSIEEEKEAFAQAVAEEVVASMQRE
jgi:AbrB family looped-hinge helix DNA binding protein